MWINFIEVSICMHCSVLLSVTWKCTWSLFYEMLHDIWSHEPTSVFLIISQIILNSVCKTGGNPRTVKMLMYMKWLELCIYTSLPCVQSSFQIIIYLWGTNKNKWARLKMLFEAIVTWRWIQKVQCDWGMHVVIPSLRTSLNCPWAIPTYLSGTVLQLQTLIFSFIKFMLVTVKIEVCSKFLCYFHMINTNLDIHHWKFTIESGDTWLQIMPWYLPTNGIQCQWQEKEVPRNQTYQQTQQLVTQMCHKIYFRSLRRVEPTAKTVFNCWTQHTSCRDACKQEHCPKSPSIGTFLVPF